MFNKICITKISLLICIVLLIVCSNNSNAQIRYSELDTIDNVVVSYRWQRSNIFDKESRTILNLRLENNNEYPANITFQVGFYVSSRLKHGSEEIEKCLTAGETKRGGSANLRFQYEKFTREDIESDEFDWEFLIFDVKEVERCIDIDIEVDDN